MSTNNPDVTISDASREYFGRDVVDLVTSQSNMSRGKLGIYTDADIRPENLAQFKEHLAAAGQSKLEGTITDNLQRGVTEFQPVGKTPDPSVAATSNFITVAKIDSPKSHVHALTGIPEDKLTNIPGTAKDWRAAALIHETSHYRHDHIPGHVNGKARHLGEEHEADNDADKLYAEAQKRGIVSQADIPDTMNMVRGISYMNAPHEARDSTRAYALAATNHTETSHEDNKTQAYKVEEAKDKVLARIGDSQLSENQRYRAVLSGLNPHLDEVPKDIDTYFNSDASYTKQPVPQEIKTSLDKVKAGLTPEQAEQSRHIEDMNLRSAAAPLGAELAAKNPALLYSTATQMEQEGVFKDSKVQTEFIQNFKRGAETLAPSHYNAPPAPAVKVSMDASQDNDSALPKPSMEEMQALLARPTLVSANSEPAVAPPQAAPAPVPSRQPDFAVG